MCAFLAPTPALLGSGLAPLPGLIELGYRPVTSVPVVSTQLAARVWRATDTLRVTSVGALSEARMAGWVCAR